MRLIIVSNRLPVTLSIKDGSLCLTESAGGLATGLTTYLAAYQAAHPEAEHLWVGWPGSDVPDALKEEADTLLASRGLSAVYLNSDEQDTFYNGLCNDTLWPLFHYFPTLAQYESAWWESYTAVNQRFAEQVAALVRPGDVVWVHDYQLILTPRLLRALVEPGIPIGFFLHTPFPSFEVFRLLPREWRRALLLGVLGSDLAGFHTYDYAQYFAGCVERILGHERTAETIALSGRTVSTGVYPIGIDFAKFYEGAADPSVSKEREVLRAAIGKQKLVLSIDRLDYTKGIDKRLLGYERFLEEHPEYEGRVTLALVVIPSRTEVPRYAEMKCEIDELVGRINGRWGTMEWTPIRYQYSSVPFAELSALYSLADVALVTPLRDGMNLIAKEYIASRRDQSGVLVLSEMAGAAHELGEAVLINPNHTDELSHALAEALEVPLATQKQNNASMQERLRNYDIVRWGNDFVEDLNAHKSRSCHEHTCAPFSAEKQEKVVRDFAHAKKRLILLDYDGTLVPFAQSPLLAKPVPDLLQTLTKLTHLQNTKVAILSGRGRDVLEKWLGTTGVELSAEHGAWLYNDGTWSSLKAPSTEWKETVMPILRTYVDRVPGTLLEEKEYSVVWHYRMAAPAMGNMRAKELINTLRSVTSGTGAYVQKGSKIVEVRANGIDKGATATHFLDSDTYDFVLAMGDDTTDEDMFRVLPKNAYTIKVRPGKTTARFSVEGSNEAVALLEALSGKRMVEWRS